MNLPMIDWPELSLQMMLTFGHFLWQACVVAVVLVVAEKAFDIVSGGARALRAPAPNEPTPDGSRRSANVRYTFACLAFFSLPVCVAATFAGVHQSFGPIILVASDPIDLSANPELIAYESSPRLIAESPTLPPDGMAVDNAVHELESAVLPRTAIPAPSWTARIEAFSPYLLVAYVIGVGFMLARFAVSIAGSSRLRRTLQPITDSQLLKIIAEQSSRIGYRIKRLLGDDHTPRISLTRSFVAAIALAAVFGGLSMIAVAQSDGDDATLDDSSNGEVAAWGDESRGLQCRIVPVSPLMDAENVDLSNPVDRFESPDEITFAVEIKNVSGHPIRLKDVRYGESYGDSKGKRRANHFAPHLFEFAFTDTDGNAIARTRRALR